MSTSLSGSVSPIFFSLMRSQATPLQPGPQALDVLVELLAEIAIEDFEAERHNVEESENNNESSRAQ